MLHLGNLIGGRTWKGQQAGTRSRQPCAHMSFQMPEILSRKKQTKTMAGRGLGIEAELLLDPAEHTEAPNWW